MDFVSDQLHDGRKLRVLTVVDTYTRECLATEVGQRLNSTNVVAVLSRIVAARGKPHRIFCD
ncbi:MAG: DDE-type integrase/transposase/recombinase, partial [Chromatiales bacterium]|nr:DDE-type integrase/transposase/recombinase [Chromatiales bacterium]